MPQQMVKIIPTVNHNFTDRSAICATKQGKTYSENFTIPADIAVAPSDGPIWVRCHMDDLKVNVRQVQSFKNVTKLTHGMSSTQQIAEGFTHAAWEYPAIIYVNFNDFEAIHGEKLPHMNVNVPEGITLIDKTISYKFGDI